jgi:hypothetical protein
VRGLPSRRPLIVVICGLAVSGTLKAAGQAPAGSSGSRRRRRLRRRGRWRFARMNDSARRLSGRRRCRPPTAERAPANAGEQSPAARDGFGEVAVAGLRDDLQGEVGRRELGPSCDHWSIRARRARRPRAERSGRAQGDPVRPRRGSEPEDGLEDAVVAAIARARSSNRGSARRGSALRLDRKVQAPRRPAEPVRLARAGPTFERVAGAPWAGRYMLAPKSAVLAADVS